MLVQGSQFTLDEVEVITATVDLEDVRSYRGSVISRGMQVMEAESYPRCFLEVALSHDQSVAVATTPPTHVQYYMPEEEIRYTVGKTDYSVLWTCTNCIYVIH